MAIKRPPTEADLSEYLQHTHAIEVPWNRYFEVCPIRFNWKREQDPGKVLKVGKLLVRSVLLGFRFFAEIIRGVDGSFFAVLPRYRAGDFGWAPYLSWDNPTETDSFLKWAAEVWCAALIDGEGRLPHRGLNASRYTFNPVTGGGHLVPNPRARLRVLPWSVADDGTGGRYVSDVGASTTTAIGNEEAEAGPGGIEGHSTEAELPAPVDL